MPNTSGWHRHLPRRSARQGWLHDHMLTIVLSGLFLISWLSQFLTELTVVTDEAKERGKTFSWDEFWPQFLSATFENWQSEFLQLFTFVVLTTYLIHRNSAESPDGDDEIKAMLKELLARTEPTERDAGPVSPA